MSRLRFNHTWRAIFLLLIAALWQGCATIAPLTPVDLNAGWTVRQGQAVWKPDRAKPEIAGELIVATHPDGSSYVQFSKNPFNIVTAQRTPKTWEVEFGPEGKRYSGRGAGPKRLFWLFLPDMLEGKPLKGWVRTDSNGSTSTFRHDARGEELQIALD